MKSDDDFDLDNILESALEDFEANETTGAPTSGLPAPSTDIDTNSPPSTLPGQNGIENLFSSSLGNDLDANLLGDFSEMLDKLCGDVKDEEKDEKPEDFDAKMAATLQNLQQSLQNSSKTTDSGMGFDNLPDMSDESFGQMMQTLESNPEFQTLMDGMMHQLLAKDILYEPMVDIQDKYPKWLKENKSKLSPGDYSEYEAQYKCVQRIVALYEEEDVDLKRIMTTMQEMHEHGTPPEEIVKDLAPEMNFDPEGLPMLPGLGAKDCVMM